MAPYAVDPDRSTVTAVLRAGTDRPLSATIRGRLELEGGRGPVTGRVQVVVWDAPSNGRELDLDVAATAPEVDRDSEGRLLLRGSASRPAGTFGIAGTPLLNPTVVLRWRAVLVSDD